ncbi:MAG TPA: molybdenum cofactor guanylyltransferase [Candidatus Micrarchaeia archaeon]|nr:molybdenum cofactor guanylyltransferase [Candidatus Micrarchaeia archaeon]
MTLLILAGGASRRAGRDKASFRTAGGRLIDLPYRALSPLASRCLVAGPSSCGLPCPAVADPASGLGPLAGLVQGLTRAATSLVLVVACDMPSPSPILGRHLLRRAWHDPAVDAVVPWRGGRPEPLFAVYRASAGPLLAGALEGGERTLRRALASLRVAPIAASEWAALDPDGLSFRNCNTWAELRALRGAATALGSRR